MVGRNIASCWTLGHTGLWQEHSEAGPGHQCPFHCPRLAT